MPEEITEDSVSFPSNIDEAIHIARKMPRHIHYRLKEQYPTKVLSSESGEYVAVSSPSKSITLCLRPRFEPKDSEGYYRAGICAWVDEMTTGRTLPHEGIQKLSSRSPAELDRDLEGMLKKSSRWDDISSRIKFMGFEREPSLIENNSVTLRGKFNNTHSRPMTNRIVIYDSLVRPILKVVL